MNDAKDYFRISGGEERISSINRTIRLKPELFDGVTKLSESTGVSFNKIVNQCIEYALTHMEDTLQYD